MRKNCEILLRLRCLDLQGQVIWHKLESVHHLLSVLQTQGETIMADQQKALEALQKINEASNEQADSLQAISDHLDGLIARAGTSVPPDVLQGLQAAADHIAAQAEFSKQLASKGADNPVPVPPPDLPPTPTPTPTPPPVP